jgi:hypothetical protein
MGIPAMPSPPVLTLPKTNGFRANSLVCPIVSRKESGNHERPDRIRKYCRPAPDRDSERAPNRGAAAGQRVGTVRSGLHQAEPVDKLRSMQMQILPGGTLMYKNVPLRAIISQAYNLPFNSLEWMAGPKWIDSEKFDIEARAPQDSQYHLSCERTEQFQRSPDP